MSVALDRSLSTLFRLFGCSDFQSVKGVKARLPLAILMLVTVFFSSSSLASIIIEHPNVFSTVAYGTVTVDGGPFADLDALFSSNYLSNELALAIGEIYFGGPPFEPLIGAYGTLTNLEFLTGTLTDLGDPVVAVENAFTGYLVDINTSIGGGATINMNTVYRGTESYALYGGVLSDQPQPGDTTIITGTGNVAMYEVTAAITLPRSVLEPATLALTGLGFAGIGYGRKRRLAK